MDLQEIHSPLALSVFDKLANPDAKKCVADLVDAPPDAIDLIEKCLTFTPSKRITAQEALSHKYMVDKFRDKKVEADSEGSRKIRFPDEISDNKKETKKKYQGMIHDLIKKKNADIKA